VAKKKKLVDTADEYQEALCFSSSSFMGSTAYRVLRSFVVARASWAMWADGEAAVVCVIIAFLRRHAAWVCESYLHSHGLWAGHQNWLEFLGGLRGYREGAGGFPLDPLSLW